jgi:hypothetical protein
MALDAKRGTKRDPPRRRSPRRVHGRAHRRTVRGLVDAVMTEERYTAFYLSDANAEAREQVRIYSDGRVVIAEGLSAEDAVRAMYKAMRIQAMRVHELLGFMDIP